MQLLDFKMPPFARTAWASKQLKDKWEPKVDLAVKAYAQLEHLSVKHGLRKCKTAHIANDRLVDSIQSFAREGLHYVPIQEVGAYTGFSHYHVAAVPGQPSTYYGALSTDIKYATEFMEASVNLDHTILARLLGYPECCTKFFLEVWQEKEYIDPVWQEYENTAPEHVKTKSEYKIRTRNTLAPESNTLLKYIGIRVMPHIPCSPDCAHSLKMAKDWIQLGRDLKIAGVEELLELLSMPVEWDALKGISYISTPIFKIETNTVTCYPKYVVQREGTFFPEDAPGGLKFPWNEAMRRKVAQTV